MRIALATFSSRKVVPLGMLYIAAVLRRSGHQVLWREASDEHDLLRALEHSKVDIVAFSVTTGMHHLYLKWARKVRSEFGAYTIFGGPHPTFVPNVVREEGVDAICIGEAEHSIVELVDRIGTGLSGKPIPGVWFKPSLGTDPSRIVRGPTRQPPADLDVIPSPAFDLVYDSDRRGRYSVKPFIASRGCLYRCAYCANSGYLSLYGQKKAALRLRSPRAVVEEMRWVKSRWPLDLVWLADASLLSSRPWADELVGRIRSDIGRRFFCKLRPDHIDAATARMLSRAGCHAVGLGIEHGNERIRRSVLKRAMSDDVIVEACRHLREAGIRVVSFNMIGIPTETLDTAMQTVDLNVRCRPDYAEAMLLQPYPGTALARWATREGYFDGDFDGIDYSYLSTSPMKWCDDLERDRFERLQRLFALAVEFPDVRAALRRLVEIPSSNIYDAAFELWYTWSFGRRIHDQPPWR